MADEYQLRKDIDKIYFRVYDVENDRLLVYTKDEMNALLDANYFDQSEVLKLIQEGGGDLSNYYTKIEINTILSSYVTNQTLEDYALKSELFSGSYNDLEDVPSSFPPSAHTHTVSDVTDFPLIPSKTSDLTNDGEDGINAFVSDDDSRLSDARTPISHTHDDRYYTETEIDTVLEGKQDIGDCVTSIALVPKSSDSTGAIRLYYGDEP